jgi:hypothetical protein
MPCFSEERLTRLRTRFSYSFYVLSLIHFRVAKYLNISTDSPVVMAENLEVILQVPLRVDIPPELKGVSIRQKQPPVKHLPHIDFPVNIGSEVYSAIEKCQSITQIAGEKVNVVKLVLGGLHGIERYTVVYYDSHNQRKASHYQKEGFYKL